MFLWQLPHFLAIAWMYRDDYARAGLPMLPVVDKRGAVTGRQAALWAAMLIPFSVLPVRCSDDDARLRGRRDRARPWAAAARGPIRPGSIARQRPRAVPRIDHLPAAALGVDVSCENLVFVNGAMGRVR